MPIIFSNSTVPDNEKVQYIYNLYSTLMTSTAMKCILYLKLHLFWKYLRTYYRIIMYFQKIKYFCLQISFTISSLNEIYSFISKLKYTVYIKMLCFQLNNNQTRLAKKHKILTLPQFLFYPILFDEFCCFYYILQAHNKDYYA